MKRNVNDFLFHCKFEKNLNEKTINAYEIDLKQFNAYCVNEQILKISDIDKNNLKKYIEIIMSKYKPKTVKRKMATTKAFFNFLHFENEIKINPFSQIRIRIKEGIKIPRTIDPLIIRKLFKHLYKLKNEYNENTKNYYYLIIRDIAILELLFATGLRVSELSNLKLSQVDFNEKTIRIVGKGNRERLIPICNPEVITALKCYYREFDSIINETGYFFINRLHKRFSEQSIRFMIKRYLSELDININITPHMFRHSVATMLLENEVDIRYIQDLLGHSSINTTQIYLSVNKKKQRKILTKKHPRNRLF